MVTVSPNPGTIKIRSHVKNGALDGDEGPTDSVQLAPLTGGEAARNREQNHPAHKSPGAEVSVLCAGVPHPGLHAKAALVALELSGSIFMCCVTVNFLLVLSHKSVYKNACFNK